MLDRGPKVSRVDYLDKRDGRRIFSIISAQDRIEKCIYFVLVTKYELVKRVQSWHMLALLPCLVQPRQCFFFCRYCLIEIMIKLEAEGCVIKCFSLPE